MEREQESKPAIPGRASGPHPPPDRRARHLAARPLLAIGLGLALAALESGAACAETGGAPFDLVLRGGRVIDPLSGLDGVRDVGIRAGSIAAISEDRLEGDRVLDAAGRVVAPGFIDLHTHTPTPLGQYYQLLDGVTTALELEAGAASVEGIGNELETGARIHYGASAGWAAARVEALVGIRVSSLFGGSPRPVGPRGWWTVFKSLFGGGIDEVFTRPATDAERERMRQLIAADLDAGALGIGLPLDYFSEAVDEAELRMVFELAAERQTIVFMHVRRGVNGDPTGLREAIRHAEETGAALHVCHITHNAMRNIDLFLREIREARDRGVDVSTELLPYNAGSAPISSAVFGRDWRTIFAIDYADVEWAATGMRFDERTWNEYRETYPEGQVVHHYLKDEWTRRALAEPGVIVVSDLLRMVDETSMVAPHNGAFSRVLGRYARDAGVLTMPDALARMTALPAARLAAFFPAFARKGRIQVGADADVTVFDPGAVLDRATYGDPFQPSAGIVHVVVDGEIAVETGAALDGVFAGRLMRGELATD